MSGAEERRSGGGRGGGGAHIRLQQRAADVLHGLLDVLGRELSCALQFVPRLLQTGAQVVEDVRRHLQLLLPPTRALRPPTRAPPAEVVNASPPLLVPRFISPVTAMVQGRLSVWMGCGTLLPSLPRCSADSTCRPLGSVVALALCSGSSYPLQRRNACPQMHARLQFTRLNAHTAHHTTAQEKLCRHPQTKPESPAAVLHNQSKLRSSRPATYRIESHRTGQARSETKPYRIIRGCGGPGPGSSWVITAQRRGSLMPHGTGWWHSPRPPHRCARS